MSFVIVLAALAFLMFAAYRGYSVILVAPIAALGAVLLQGAERIALTDLPWLPIRFLSQSEAVGPRVGGYVQNPRDFNRSRWLWVK